MSRWRTLALLVSTALLVASSTASGASGAVDTGTTRESVAAGTANGDPADESSRALISGDGRVVVFHSDADNLVTNDHQPVRSDVFWRNIVTNRTLLVNVTPAGQSGDSWSTFPAVSNNGRYVAFQSSASNLVPQDTGDASPDIFRADFGSTPSSPQYPPRMERVSVLADGRDAPGRSTRPSISDDGRWVAFSSTAQLAPSDGDTLEDIYLRDMSKAPGDAGAFTRITRGGGTADDDSFRAILSGNGNFVTFVSDLANLVPGDTNAKRDVFRWVRLTDRIERVSLASDGGQLNQISTRPWINASGRYVTFQTTAVATPGDANRQDDVFVRDMDAAPGSPTFLRRASVTPSGGDAKGASTRIQINGDGRYVVFASNSHQLIARDRNGLRDVFRRDMLRGVTERVSVNHVDGGDGSCPGTAAAAPTGGIAPLARPGAPGISTRADVSNDGSKVVFVSGMCNLVPSDDNGRDDIFVRRMPTP